MGDVDIWRHQDASVFGGLPKARPSFLVGEDAGPGTPRSPDDDPRRCLRFDDFSGWSEGFRYPRMARSMAVHQHRGGADSLHNLVWKGDVKGVKRLIAAGQRKAAAAKTQLEQHTTISKQTEPDPQRRKARHARQAAAAQERKESLMTSMGVAASPRGSRVTTAVGTPPTPMQRGSVFAAAPLMPRLALSDPNGFSTDDFNSEAFADSYRKRRAGAVFDIDALGLVTDTFPGYEKGTLRKHYGLFIESYAHKFHAKLQLKRFVKRPCQEVSECGVATPLHWACAKGDSTMIGLLLRAGASQWVLAGCGAAPLHVACGNYHPEAVITLLTHAAATPRANICKCLAIAHGNPYTVLHAGHWLQRHKMQDHFKAQAHHVKETEESLVEMSGKYGKMNLECFLHFEPFDSTARTPIPLPPYRYRVAVDTTSKAHEMKKLQAESDAKALTEAASQPRRRSNRRGTGALRSARGSCAGTPRTSRHGSMGPPKATPRRGTSIRLVTSEKCTQTPPLELTAETEHAVPGGGIRGIQARAVATRQATAMPRRGTAPPGPQQNPLEAWGLLNNPAPSHCTSDAGSEKVEPFVFSVEAVCGPLGDLSPIPHSTSASLDSDAAPAAAPRRQSAVGLMLECSRDARQRLRSLGRIAEAMVHLGTAEQLPLPPAASPEETGNAQHTSTALTLSVADAETPEAVGSNRRRPSAAYGAAPPEGPL
eukprot:TRINITY_DN30139_c0_g1_i1.p1 TRINITY_DN30139_c0_g1~~TRINITY_DN30139_c0_g1_i1.p1  ORF type:complete len:709 (+),score=188.22 TRINITY_DN30139_c0_g1_i1:111-2237(+)